MSTTTGADAGATQPKTGLAKITRGHSCLTCSNRKVKCDGGRPCATCVKSGSDCRSAVRQRKNIHQRQPPTLPRNDHLLTRCRKYEALLKAHGVDPETPEPDDRSAHAEQVSSSRPEQSSDGHMIIQHGRTRFVESTVWQGLQHEFSDQLPDSDDEYDATNATEGPATPADLIFSSPSGELPSNSHPTVPQILMLWQTFRNNFDPLVKLFHGPSAQQIVFSAIGDMTNIIPPHEALMFAIYLAAVTTLSDEESNALMGQSKEALIARYSSATQSGLVRAGFLRCRDLVLLQALTLYLLACRQQIDSSTLWLLSGVANRIGQTMGLHRESSLRELPPFEAEIRRRLWWQIVILDSRSAQLSGATTDASFWDTARPLNISDSDMWPSMQELPPERDGPTEMLFSTVRTEIGECMRRVKTCDKNQLLSTETCMAQKTQLIDECKAKLNERILRKLDASTPFHLFALYLAKSAFMQMSLSALHPQQYPDKGASMVEQEKHRLFDLALQIVTFDSLPYHDKNLRGYLWHVSMQFPFEAFILVLTELLSRTSGDEIEQAWSRVNQAYEDHPRFITETMKNHLYFALGNLTLKAWGKRVDITRKHNSPRTLPMNYPAISKLQVQRQRRSPPARVVSQGQVTVPKHEPGQDHAAAEEFTVLDPSNQADWDHLSGDQFMADVADTDWDFWNGLLSGVAGPNHDFGANAETNFQLS